MSSGCTSDFGDVVLGAFEKREDLRKSFPARTVARLPQVFLYRHQQDSASYMDTDDDWFGSLLADG